MITHPVEEFRRDDDKREILEGCLVWRAAGVDRALIYEINLNLETYLFSLNLHIKSLERP